MVKMASIRQILPTLPFILIRFIYTHQREKLESVEEEYRQERALSARAHHNCELNEREARRFHALVERHRSATAAFVVGLERRGLIERGTSSSASFTESDVHNQLDSVCSQLLLSFGNLEVRLST